MSHGTTSRMFGAIGIALLVAATGCSKTDEQTTTSQTMPPSKTAENIQVARIEMGRSVDVDKRVADVTMTFQPTETVYASVVTQGAAPSAELKARWTFQDGQLVAESSQTIAPTGNDATEFHLSKVEGLPAGKYRVEVFLNGVPAGTQEFEVKGA